MKRAIEHVQEDPKVREMIDRWKAKTDGVQQPVFECDTCSDTGLVDYEYPWQNGDETEMRKGVARCLCLRGFRASRSIPRLNVVFSGEALEARWPAYRQIADRRPVDISDLQEVGITPAQSRWTLASYPDQEAKHLRSAESWTREPLEQRSDLVLFGPPGTGKTGLAIGMIRELLEVGETVRFVDANALLTVLKASFRSEAEISEDTILKDLQGVPVLALDDLTSPERLFSHGDHYKSSYYQDVLRQIVDVRQRFNRPTILTLNAGQEDLAPFFGPALFDRLRARATFWTFTGPSRRPTNRREASRHA